MVAEVVEHLEPGRGGVFVDCTVGLGGHARALPPVSFLTWSGLCPSVLLRAT